MSLDLGLEFKQSQQLVLTPQLQQAIRLLQLSRNELIEAVREELMSNPLLEETSELTSTEAHTESLEEVRAREAREASPEVEGDGEITAQTQEQIDWESYFENYNSPMPQTPRMNDDELPNVEATLSRGQTLFDHLLWQIQVSGYSPQEQRVALEIIGNLNEDGYLADVSLKEIAQELDQDEEYVEEVLELVQHLDPVGVGARNLQECLLIQAQFCELGAIVCDILSQHFDHWIKKNYAQIARSMGIELDEVLEASRLISQLEPKPGRIFSGEEPHYITPDIYIRKIDGEYRAVFNDDGMPHLKISNFYRATLSNQGQSDVKKYVQEKLNAASFMIRSLQQRQQTIVRVAECIIELQRDFLDHGVEALKPMILRDVAERTHTHESTISRVTTNKYVHTPQGIFELKFFFNSGVVGESGEDMASRAVQNKIKQLIDHEQPAHPLSDQKLTEILETEGIHIARRTVAKYREALKIPSSSQRKRMF